MYSDLLSDLQQPSTAQQPLDTVSKVEPSGRAARSGRALLRQLEAVIV